MPVVPNEARYRVLVVDDERLARVGLRAMLAAHPELELAGEASNGVEATAAIRQLSPDIVFLDIQMPDKDGFRLLAELRPHERPAVVFVTAHRQYAFDAFGVSAIDYLLKPYSRQRLALAVRRAVRLLRGAAAEVEVGVTGDSPRAASRTSGVQRLAVRDRDRLVFVDPADVCWFEVYGNYVRIAVNGRHLLLRTTLSMLAGQLDPLSFVRISRSVVVNLQHVKSARHHANGHYELILTGGTAWRSSRRYRRAVRAALGEKPFAYRTHSVVRVRRHEDD
jgi:two-component system LytT family response regulator